MAKVAIIYKRSAVDDEHVMDLLSQKLRAEGHDVFLDLDVPVGTKWAHVIRSHISNADHVIVLLSERSIGSEMVEGELSVASESQAQRNGSPHILPVRVKLTQELPPNFAAILDPLQFVHWAGPEDDTRVTNAILQAIQSPASELAVPLEPVGGAMPLDSHFYIERPTDHDVERALEKQDGLILIKGARQMGKTSLMARAFDKARKDNSQVVFTDFQALNEAHFSSVDSFYRALCSLMARRLNVNVKVADFWDDYLDPNGNFEAFLETYAVPPDVPFVWCLDEVDRLFGRPYASEVFGLFRSWFNMRAMEPDRRLSRMTMVIAYATEPHLFIADLNQSPFNVGTRLRLNDFTSDEVQRLNTLHGNVLKTQSEFMRLYNLVGGHPFLLRRAMGEMVQEKTTLAQIETEAFADDGLFGDHLRRMVMAMAADNSLDEAARSLLRQRPIADELAFVRLRRAGVVVGESQKEARFRCKLYEVYLQRHLM